MVLKSNLLFRDLIFYKFGYMSACNFQLSYKTSRYDVSIANKYLCIVSYFRFIVTNTNVDHHVGH